MENKEIRGTRYLIIQNSLQYYICIGVIITAGSPNHALAADRKESRPRSSYYAVVKASEKVISFEA